jgi:hypothetical protein
MNGHMMKSQSIAITIGLCVVMLITRGSHVSGWNALPEASWMVFFIAGLLLPRWSLAAFLGLAVGIDAYAFTFGGVPGTCLSVAYAMLIPAYSVMWIAGRLVQPYFESTVTGHGVTFTAAMLATAVCELISSGSFYLWSGLFEPTWAEFLAREIQYAPAAFASSAFWAIAFIASHRLYCRYQHVKATGELTT